MSIQSPLSGSVQSNLWIPKVPSHQGLTVSAVEPSQPPNAFEPLIDMNFGGQGGVLLGDLTGITVHMVSDRCPITGIDFIYRDKTLRFGSGGGTELMFCIEVLAANASKILESN